MVKEIAPTFIYIEAKSIKKTKNKGQSKGTDQELQSTDEVNISEAEPQSKQEETINGADTNNKVKTFICTKVEVKQATPKQNYDLFYEMYDYGSKNFFKDS